MSVENIGLSGASLPAHASKDEAATESGGPSTAVKVGDRIAVWFYVTEIGEHDVWLHNHPGRVGMFQATAEAPVTDIAPAADLKATLERVARWINTSVPIGTEAATTMLGIVQAALATTDPRS